ncbi:MAG TPA: GNAT family N-acetyltransferase [Candidatus Koribacter sp.]|jgi:ribosomal protein S18 acetylase RimI-like enzyme
MEIRELGSADALAYWKLRLQGLEHDPLAFGKAPEEFRAISIQELEKRLRDMPSRSFFVGAFEGGELIGIATFMCDIHAKNRHKGHIYGVYVAPTHRGKRIGHELIAKILERAKKDRVLEQIVLAVATSQKPAIRLYRSLGFQEYGTEPRALKNGDQYVDELLMMLRLK